MRDQIAGGVSLHENQFSALEELEAFNRLLGQRLGEMHMTLAVQTDNQAFAAEPTTASDAKEWTQLISGQVEHALDLLQARRGDLDRKTTAQVDQLLDQRKQLLAEVKRLANRTLGGLRTRVHGDLHLGQILVAQGDAYFIDFEGEPARSLEERRSKLSPFKDVAGVLRSFEYATAMTLRNAQSSDSSEVADQARRTISDTYQQSARAVFLEAYREAIAELPHAWKDAAGADAALALFSLEKTAYEVAYEAENRPAWLTVPLQGLATLAQQISDGGSR